MPKRGTHSQELLLPDLARRCGPTLPGHLFGSCDGFLRLLCGGSGIHLARGAGLVRRSGPDGRCPECLPY